jgi:hypothetical protein
MLWAVDRVDGGVRIGNGCLIAGWRWCGQECPRSDGEAGHLEFVADGVDDGRAEV